MFKNGKAVGPDGIGLHTIKNLGKGMLNIVCKLYDAAIVSGYTPQIWRQSKVIFIPKPGKKDYAQAKSFRPISLTPFLFKTLERLL